MPRKIKTAFESAPESDRSLTGIHDIAFIARERDGVRGVEVRVGGGTSIMPRVAPTLYDFVGLDDGEYLEVAEAVFRIFDRQDWLRVNRARARIKVLVDKIGIEEMRRLVDEERQGDWVAEREFDVEGLRLDVDEEERAPEVPAVYASPNGDGVGLRALPLLQRHRAAPGGLLAVQVHVPRGDLSPEQLRALADIARRYSGGWVRTTVHQNLVLRWVRDETVYEVWRALDDIGLGEAGGGHGPRRRLVPRHRLVQARHHELDGPERGGARARRGDGHHRPADPADPREDERLPERLQPAPHREHRLLRRVDPGGRPHDPRRTSRTSAATTRAATSSTASG